MIDSLIARFVMWWCKSIYTSKIKRDKKYEKIKKSNYENDGVLYYKSNVKLNGDLKGE